MDADRSGAITAPELGERFVLVSVASFLLIVIISHAERALINGDWTRMSALLDAMSYGTHTSFSV